MTTYFIAVATVSMMHWHVPGALKSTAVTIVTQTKYIPTTHHCFSSTSCSVSLTLISKVAFNFPLEVCQIWIWQEFSKISTKH